MESGQMYEYNMKEEDNGLEGKLDNSLVHAVTVDVSRVKSEPVEGNIAEEDDAVNGNQSDDLLSICVTVDVSRVKSEPVDENIIEDDGLTEKQPNDSQSHCDTEKCLINDDDDWIGQKSRDEVLHIDITGGERNPVLGYKSQFRALRFHQRTRMTNRTHSGVKPYNIHFCGEVSGTRKQDSDKGIRVKQYKCDVCAKVLSSSTALNVHYRTHTGVKPYQCDVCKKTFTDLSNLKSHQRMHTGVRPYQCEVCEKAFTYSGNLNRHHRTHSGVKPYRCDVCKKTFNQSGNLKQHQITHAYIKPYQCDICEKAFTRAENLKRHQRTHAGVRPYQCDVREKTELISLKGIR